MVGNGDVVLAALARCQPQVAASLAGGFVAEAAERLGEISAREVSW